jgi:hypothetical protein
VLMISWNGRERCSNGSALSRPRRKWSSTQHRMAPPRIQSHSNASRASRICRVARHRRGIFEEAVQSLPERAEIVAPSRALVNYLPQQIVVGPGQKLDPGGGAKGRRPSGSVQPTTTNSSRYRHLTLSHRPRLPGGRAHRPASRRSFPASASRHDRRKPAPARSGDRGIAETGPDPTRAYGAAPSALRAGSRQRFRHRAGGRSNRRKIKFSELPESDADWRRLNEVVPSY